MMPRSGRPILMPGDAIREIVATMKQRSPGRVLSFDIRITGDAEDWFFKDLGALAHEYGYCMRTGEKKEGYVVARFLRTGP